MLYYCAYTWHHGTRPEQARKRFLELDSATGGPHAGMRAWYSLAGGGAGFMLLEAEDPREVTALFQPWMDLLSVDVRAIYELDYQALKERFQQLEQQAS